ncbi:MAG: CHAP domain-containing protein [Winogradskyella sp.]|uniref:CHAP domain-containing protein n=1 Tax=Winogradskyella sp. TaxID=1883156 RepID=UPI0025F0CE3F|nr:CHAP domain-containing protein [Winogradskyella sp.]NRB59445.1 CHAP domain-containing protein [Winogradskyella sp.]
MKKLLVAFVFLFFVTTVLIASGNKRFNSQHFKVGQKIDSLNGIYVYYNGDMDNVSGRNMQNGYNLGLKYQCVEYVKRYYYWHYNHKMPNSYGHAKDFFEDGLKDGELNKDRNLSQYTNKSTSKPEIGDLIVFDGNVFNPYGHVAIVSKVSNDEIEIIQQNVGTTTRENYTLKKQSNKWYINDSAILGWLRKCP